ncbi:MAG TPA: DddA-like double-stranded DNA deaminase toxin [Pseudonocardiaceae bacterium]
MMIAVSSITELVSDLRQVLQKLADGRDQQLRVAERAWTEGQAILAHVLGGSARIEAQVLIDQAGLLTEQLAETRALIDRCTEKIEAFIYRLQGGSAGPPAAALASAKPQQDRVPVQPMKTRAEQAKQRVGRSPVGSSPAHGEWVRSDGWNIRMRSGNGDDYYHAVVDFVRQLSPEMRPAGRLATHIEAKVAVQMRLTGSKEETVVVDRTVCGTREFDKNQRWTCANQLERTFLPPGAKLHVIDPVHGKVTYGKEEGQ